MKHLTGRKAGVPAQVSRNSSRAGRWHARPYDARAPARWPLTELHPRARLRASFDRLNKGGPGRVRGKGQM